MNNETSLVEQIYQEGYDAYLQGIDVDECPYEQETQAAQIWKAGWNESYDRDFPLWLF